MVSELKYLFPDAVIGKDIILQDDGAGVFIAQWNLQALQPTQAEIDAATVASASADLYVSKWEQITAQIDDLTVTVNGHKYASNKSAMTEINIKISSLDGTETISWYEPWGSFQTNKLELQQVVIASCQAEQLIIDQIMGA